MPRNKNKKKNDQAPYIPGMGPPPQQTAPPATEVARPVRRGGGPDGLRDGPVGIVGVTKGFQINMIL